LYLNGIFIVFEMFFCAVLIHFFV
jgi:hypothetical protein